MNFRRLVSAVAALAVAGTCVVTSGVSVLADEGNVTNNVSIDFTASTSIPDEFVVNSQTDAIPFELDSTTGWMRIGNGNASVTIDDTELAGTTDKVTVSFDMVYVGLSNRAAGYYIADSNGTKIVNWSCKVYNGTIDTNVLGTGDDLSAISEISYLSKDDPGIGNTMSYTFEIDFGQKTVKQTLYNTATDTTYEHTNQLPDGVTDVKTINFNSGYTNYTARRCYLNNINVTTTEGASSVAYKIEYQLDGSTVYTVEDAASVGAKITAVSQFEVGEQRYIVDSPQTFEAKSSADDNSWTQECRKADNFSYTANATYDGTVLKQLATGSVVEGDSATIAYPLYVLDGSNVYTKTANTSSGDYHHYTFTPTSDNYTESVEYSEYATNGIYYAEMEDVLGEKSVSNADIRCSMAAGGDTDETGATITTLPAGTYTINGVVWGGGKNEGNNSTYAIEVNGDTVWTATTTGALTPGTATEFIITDDTDIVIKKTETGSSSACVDFILIIGTVAPTITTSADDDNSVSATAIGEAVTAKLVSNESTTLSLAANDTVYTIWVKVENSTEKPSVTIIDNTGTTATADTTMAEVFESGDHTGYYCIQIVPDTLLTGGTVTFSVTGATSKTITLN